MTDALKRTSSKERFIHKLEAISKHVITWNMDIRCSEGETGAAEQDECRLFSLDSCINHETHVLPLMESHSKLLGKLEGLGYIQAKYLSSLVTFLFINLCDKNHPTHFSTHLRRKTAAQFCSARL